MPRILTIIVLSALIGACATPEPVITDDMLAFDGDMPADFSGSWERDYDSAGICSWIQTVKIKL